MNWYKTARKFTDQEQWILHGVDPQACRDEFKGRHAKIAGFQKQATQQVEQLGHKLFENWTAFQSNRCRKCGHSVKIDVVYDQPDKPIISGAATSVKCTVNLTGHSDFSTADRYLKDVNVPPQTTIV